MRRQSPITKERLDRFVKRTFEIRALWRFPCWSRVDLREERRVREDPRTVSF